MNYMERVMKRKILFLAVFLLIIATLPWLLMQRGGNGFLPLTPDRGTESTASTRQTFYKWQDASGQWHFGEQVPAGVQAVAINVDTAANIIQSVKAPAPAAEPATAVISKETLNDNAPPAPLPGVPFTVNPTEIPQLLEKTKQLQQQMGQRQQQIDAVR
ncbi:DUF4124 domain-containing protein [Oceanospirillaceae bacterium ASx5O]|nr:DUF4124 domain-containing protein [Oceanospirillaceae bacterium ASx5O]